MSINPTMAANMLSPFPRSAGGAGSFAFPYAAAAGAVLGGGSSIFSALGRNSALERNTIESARSRDIGLTQNRQQLGTQLLASRRETIRNRGAARASFADRGISGDSDSALALIDTIERQGAINRTVIEQNAQSQAEVILSRYRAQRASNQNQTISPFMAAIRGAMSGAQSGMSIGGLFQ